MGNAIRAGFIYFLLIFAVGFVLGVVRTLVLVKYLGTLTAVAIELPIILSISWLACQWIIRRQPHPLSWGQRAMMGGTALLVLLLAETVISLVLANRSFTEHLMLYQTLPVQLGLAGQFFFALFPLIQIYTQPRQP